MRRLPGLCALILLALSAACAPPPAQAQPAVWIVRDHDSEMLLFGSIPLLPPGLDWSLQPVADACAMPAHVVSEVDALLSQISLLAHPGDQIVVMSNGGFQNVPRRLAAALAGESNN